MEQIFIVPQNLTDMFTPETVSTRFIHGPTSSDTVQQILILDSTLTTEAISTQVCRNRLSISTPITEDRNEVVSMNSVPQRSSAEESPFILRTPPQVPYVVNCERFPVNEPVTVLYPPKFHILPNARTPYDESDMGSSSSCTANPQYDTSLNSSFCVVRDVTEFSGSISTLSPISRADSAPVDSRAFSVSNFNEVGINEKRALTCPADSTKSKRRKKTRSLSLSSDKEDYQVEFEDSDDSNFFLNDEDKVEVTQRNLCIDTSHQEDLASPAQHLQMRPLVQKDTSPLSRMAVLIDICSRNGDTEVVRNLLLRIQLDVVCLMSNGIANKNGAKNLMKVQRQLINQFDALVNGKTTRELHTGLLEIQRNMRKIGKW